MKISFILASVLVLATSFISSAQVRITEVDPLTDTIEIHNFGGTTVDISSYWFCGLFSYSQLSGLAVSQGSLSLDPGKSVVITGYSVNDTASDLSLYNSPSFASSAAMEDFTQWGSGGNGRESVAVAKGIWTVDTFATGHGPGVSYHYTGNGAENGVTFWTPAANDFIPVALEGFSID